MKPQRRIALVVAVQIAFLATGSIGAQFASAQEIPLDPDAQMIASALSAREKADSLIDGSSVFGAGIGRSPAGDPVILVMTSSAEDAREIPRHIDGIRVLPIVTGEIEALDCPNGPSSDCAPPVPAGVSVGHPNVSAGTLGAYLVSATGSYLALSNNHIFADENQALIGDKILQPGPSDGGNPGNPSHLLGTLVDYEPLIYCESAPCVENTLDAAVVHVSPGLVDPKTWCGWTPKADTVAPQTLVPGLTTLKKCGRTTGSTSATVLMTSVSAIVSLDDGDVMFKGLIATFDMAEPGDSGALMVDASNRPAALLFAGSDIVTLGVPIDDVLQRFDAVIATTAPSLPDSVGDEIFFYRDDGLFRFYELSTIGTLSSPLLAGDNYTTGWTSITAVDLDGDGQDEMFFYRDDGLYRYYDIRPDGTLPSPILAGSEYTTGWDSITAIDLD